MPEFDLVARNGMVVDGQGNAAVRADVAVREGVIVAVGRVAGRGTQEIEADGCVVTPGFVDVHTHYDGQITWANRMAPSSNHGVTTVVMGNCGVGFAPSQSDDHDMLIKLMEGVEDIPEVVMALGVPWNWTSFPDYLDALDQRTADVDFATQLPHSPLRVFVMGQRGVDLEPASPAELGKMRGLVTEAVRAGALGVSTSRSLFHRFRSGHPAPSVGTEDAELRALAMGLKDAGTGVFQCIPSLESTAQAEMEVLRDIAHTSGRPVNFSLLLPDDAYIDLAQQAAQEGLTIRPHFAPRPTGVLFGLDLSYHPFSLHPSYRAIASAPLAEKVERMRDPQFRRQLLSETAEDPNPAFVNIVNARTHLFHLGNPLDYHRSVEDSLAVKAQQRGIPLDELIYDTLLEDNGRAILSLSSQDPLRYVAAMRPLVESDLAVMGLGDGGAHYGMICDAAYTSYMLAQRTEGGLGHRLPALIQAMTSRPAASVGLYDRGVIAPGYKGDLNVIDLERLTLYRPEVVRDLPAGGKRLFQPSAGYRATIVSGVVTQRDDRPTGALPGRLVRGGQPAPAALRMAG